MNNLRVMRIIASTLILCGSVAGQPNNNRNNKNDKAPERQPPSVTIDSHDNYYPPEQATPKSTANPPHWYDPFKRPEWWAIGAALLSIVLLWKQTGIAKDAASAALLNAQAIIDAERALLLFSVVKDGKHNMYVVNVINYGRVPARNNEIGSKRTALMSVSDLIADPPDYGDALDGIQEYLAPKESWPVAHIIPQRTDAERFYDKTYPVPPTDLITYGQVTYRDGISPILRHSRYCIALDINDRYEPISVVGTEEYLECT